MNPNGNIRDAVYEHLRTCEEALLNPAVRRDAAQVAALLAEDFQEFGSSGKVWSREQIIELLAYEEFWPTTIEQFQCHWVGDGVVLVTYRTVQINRHSGQCLAALRSSLWTQVSGEWRMRFHQGTKAL